MLLPDQMYGNNDDNDSDGDNDNGDKGRYEDDEEDLSAEQYLREMEKILRKIRRREIRKQYINKYYKGKRKGAVIHYLDDQLNKPSYSTFNLITPQSNLMRLFALRCLIIWAGMRKCFLFNCVTVVSV